MSDVESPLLVNGDTPNELPHITDYAAVQSNVDPFTTSFHQESREVRYGRLCTLIIKAGTAWIKSYTLSKLPRGYSLSQALQNAAVSDELSKLKKRKVLQSTQYQILYPNVGGEVCEKQIDMTLWVILARNLTVDRHMINWDAAPSDDDDLPQHHILR